MCRGPEDDAINVKSARRTELIEWIEKKTGEINLDSVDWKSNELQLDSKQHVMRRWNHDERYGRRSMKK